MKVVNLSMDPWILKRWLDKINPDQPQKSVK